MAQLRAILPVALSFVFVCGCTFGESELPGEDHREYTATNNHAGSIESKDPDSSNVSRSVVTYQWPDDPLAAPDDIAEPPDEADSTHSGLVTILLNTGSGTVKPRPIDAVKVHYTGWTTNGNVFDSSHQRGEPLIMPLPRAIEGWREGLQLMVVGDIRRLWIPQELAYQGRDGFPEGTLVFDVELLGINED